MVKITKFCVEFFLERMQECILMYFVGDTVSAMDTCAAQQSTWYPRKRDCPPSPSTLYTYICHVLYQMYIYNIYIYFMNSGILQRFRKTIVFLYVPCLVPHIQPVSRNQCMLWLLKYSFIFSQIVRVSTWLLSIRQFASSWNEWNGILTMPYLLIENTHDTCAYTYISLFPVSGSDQKFIR